jgi:hypothetical protein
MLAKTEIHGHRAGDLKAAGALGLQGPPEAG